MTARRSMLESCRRVFWAGVRWPERRKFKRKLAVRSLTVPRGAPVLNYGGAWPANAGAVVAGGRVKLGHLARTWPESEQFNLLYLGSSAAPRHALDLVRWAKQWGAKFVWNQNGVAFPAWAGARLAATNEPMAALRREADFVVYQSEFCRESADQFLGPVETPSQVCLNPVDLRQFAPGPERGASEPWRLLTAGTHYQPQRVLAPIAALAHLHDAGIAARLTIAGALRWRGAEAQVRAEITRWQLGDAVELRPAFTQAQAVELYHAAQVLIHPKYQDPCPTVVIEALACGLPVIGSQSGGLPELVGEDGGVLIEVPLSWEKPAVLEPAQIAAAVRRVIADHPAWRAAARARAVRLFDAAAWVEAHRRIFTSLVGA